MYDRDLVIEILEQIKSKVLQTSFNVVYVSLTADVKSWYYFSPDFSKIPG
jgi:hypothetical protein